MQPRFTLPLFLACSLAAFASPGPSPADFAGTWVLQLGERNFIVLTLRAETNNLAGRFSRPSEIQTSDGVIFSHISSTPLTSIVVRSSIHQGHLHFVVKNPAGKSDEDQFDMTLSGEDRALLKPADFPFDALAIRRLHGAGEAKVATDWDSNRSYTSEDDFETPNAEMHRIFEEDQKPRQFTKPPSKRQWAIIEREDTGRRDATRKMIVAGQLHTGKDFEEAAFIFQHGDGPEDYLLAHTLATIAVVKGHSGAAWIAAATLDRYLQSIGKPQIYGTQFKTNSGAPATQEPYNRELIPDNLRRRIGVPPLRVQQEQVKQYDTSADKPQ